MKTFELSGWCKAGACAIILGLAGAVTAVPISLGTSTGTYTQNFDSLASANAGHAWADGVTVPGWYASRATYNAGTGSSATGALYSFGASGSSERALGSVASGGTGTIGFGVQFSNDSGLTLDSLTVAYVGEQWRNAGNTTPQSLTFWYRIAGDLTGAALNSDTGWTSFSTLDFQGPVAAQTSGMLDGNNPLNQAELSAGLSGVLLTPGQQIFLRWKDMDDTGADHGLAIDDFSFTWRSVVPPDGSTAVPDAGSTGLLLGAVLGGLGWMRRRGV